MMQLRMFPDQFSSAVPHILDLTGKTVLEKMLDAGESLRAAVDRLTKPPKYEESLVGDKLLSARIHRDANKTAQSARAEVLRGEIKGWVQSKSKAGSASRKRNG